MLLLLSKYKMKSALVVDLGKGTVDNIITQASALHMLAGERCKGVRGQASALITKGFMLF